MTVSGIALTFLAVLAPEVGAAAVAISVLVVASTVTVTLIAWRYRQRRADEWHRRRMTAASRQRALLEQRMLAGFDELGHAEGRRLLEGVVAEHCALIALLEREGGAAAASLSRLVEEIADAAYGRATSALADAQELLRSASIRGVAELRAELAGIDDRLGRNAYLDDLERARDVERQLQSREVLRRFDAAHEQARELLFQAGRCVAALTASRLELAAIHAREAEEDVDDVVATLEHSLAGVREVQNELRALGC